jgi:hypothetical protein
MRRHVSFIVSALCALCWVACSDNRGGGTIITDAKPPPSDITGFVRDGEPCVANHQCISGLCIEFGGKAAAGLRCASVCKDSSECPQLAGWSCAKDDDSAQLGCICVGDGPKPGQCNVDGDCDGKPDREAIKETCNGEDDDCNGEVDDVLSNAPGSKLYHRDADGDGFGDSGNGKWLCEPKDGWVLDATDCNDGDKESFPGGLEVCGDKLDNDCDFEVEDPDVCGLRPIEVPDLKQGISAQLSQCDLDGSVAAAYDVKEIVAKQDKTHIKFTVRLRGSPETTVCSSYKLTFGDKGALDAVVYIYRPATLACAPLPVSEAYASGQPFTSQTSYGFNAANPGHVSFVVPKSEFFGLVPDPTYQLRACTNATADATKDLTDCATDTCITPVHR